MRILFLRAKDKGLAASHFSSVSFVVYTRNMDFSGLEDNEPLLILALGNEFVSRDMFDFQFLIKACYRNGLASHVAREVVVLMNDGGGDSHFLSSQLANLANALPEGSRVYGRKRSLPGEEKLEYCAEGNGIWVLRATYRDHSQKELFRGTSDELVRFLQNPENCHISSAAMREQFAALR
ncbi:MAG: hypothetical protein COV52_07200 [Gammaproteobacteria bacterium CG11_big_fil_rev_8_21_14_0_20_46_22]|nr:MAG: hypothetical protein COW05_00215 [Gammaproteobacteria bacterium CG12_big_fil_rev_8_21_14_0_65_46_12]PIR10821.1 MAG: hypothetical protein COV52_07200 [Gammaproteobacteria bacterium CG11_big_fil_rev_8_21_14_0_20_46_22]